MNKKGFIARAAVGALGGALLIGGAGAAIADELGDTDVDVNVNIAALPPVGALTMSVASGSTSLTEVTTADEDFREFTGVLPTVTVTDDREEIPAGVFWYVVGQSTDLTAAGNLTIGAENLGWTPALLSGGDDGSAYPGDQTVPALDDPTNGPNPTGNNVGLEGKELLAGVLDSNDARPTGEWTANAALKLKTEKTVAPGSYSGTITLTLWEGLDG